MVRDLLLAQKGISYKFEGKILNLIKKDTHISLNFGMLKSEK